LRYHHVYNIVPKKNVSLAVCLEMPISDNSYRLQTIVDSNEKSAFLTAVILRSYCDLVRIKSSIRMKTTYNKRY
jgi:hypothetical protein